MEPVGWAQLNWKQRLTHTRSLQAAAAGVAAGFALAAGAWCFKIKPEEARVQKRYQSGLDIARLYGLQLDYKKAKGTYANDLDSLLALAPDGATLWANLAANADMTTLAVVGSETKFKIELNVLDGERTSIKIRGPIAPRVSAAKALVLPASAPPMNADGAPLAPGR